MERLVIVIDVPDEWRDRDRLVPELVANEIQRNLDAGGVVLPVRVRWQSMDVGAA